MGRVPTSTQLHRRLTRVAPLHRSSAATAAKGNRDRTALARVSSPTSSTAALEHLQLALTTRPRCEHIRLPQYLPPLSLARTRRQHLTPILRSPRTPSAVARLSPPVPLSRPLFHHTCTFSDREHCDESTGHPACPGRCRTRCVHSSRCGGTMSHASHVKVGPSRSAQSSRELRKSRD